MQAVRGKQPAATKLLLNTERELLKRRMVRKRAEHDDADAAGLTGPVERIGKRGATRCKVNARDRGKAEIKTWRSRITREGAGRPGKLRDRQCAVVLHQLFAGSFENNAVVIDAVA